MFICCYVPPPLIKVLKLSMHASFMGVSEEGGQQASCLEAVEFPQVLAHRHRKQGAGGATRPPSFKFGGHHPPPPPPTLPTLYIMKYCSIVDIVLHLCPLTGEGNHIFVVLKNVTPPPPPPSQSIFLRLCG